ncbi:hypothetical protein C0J52_05849 [Blattella germanica]|nr:hypothetical protein C0J52_05849 [Blattella germanica]
MFRRGAKMDHLQILDGLLKNDYDRRATPTNHLIYLFNFKMRLNTFKLRINNFKLRPNNFKLRPNNFKLRPNNFKLRPNNFKLRNENEHSAIVLFVDSNAELSSVSNKREVQFCKMSFEFCGDEEIEKTEEITRKSHDLDGNPRDCIIASKGNNVSDETDFYRMRLAFICKPPVLASNVNEDIK